MERATREARTSRNDGGVPSTTPGCSVPRRARWAPWVAAVAVLALSACSGGGETSTGGSSTPETSTPSEQSQALGGRIVFGRFSDTLGDFLLFTADPDGSNVEQLLPGVAECPRWAPDGSPTLLVCVANDAGLLRPATVQEDGSGLTILDNPDPTLNIACGAWSPDGTRLLCEAWDDTHPARNGIYTVRSSDGGDLQLVLAEPKGGEDIPGNYSPDGSQIVYTGKKAADPYACAVFVMDADGSHETRITSFGDAECGYTAWSPVGDEIVMANGGLAVLHPDGTGVRQIDLPLEGMSGVPSAYAPAWSPDGTYLLFSLSFSGAKSDLYSVALDGSDLRQVTDTHDDEEDLASWGAWTSAG
jgi:Tol biopolymer transport system component